MADENELDALNQANQDLTNAENAADQAAEGVAKDAETVVDDVKDAAEKAAGKAKKTAKKAKDKAEDAVEDVKDSAEGAKDKVEDAVKDAANDGQTVEQAAVNAAQDAGATTETLPDYASAAGERTVVSGAPAQAGDQPTAPLYVPAPEYGAYSTSTSAQNGHDQSAPTTQFSTEHHTNAHHHANAQNANQNNPYGTNQNSSIFGAANQTNQANGNPFMTNTTGTTGQTPTPASSGSSNKSMGSHIIVAIIAALAAAALCLGLGWAALSSGWVSTPTSSSLASVNSNKSGSGSATVKSGESVDWASVAKSVSNSVVSIQCEVSEGEVMGSGAVIDTEGHIVTNNHVVEDAQQIQVTLSNGNIYSAKLVGADTTTDLAVIKLDNPPSDLTAVEFADSDTLAVGENVMAIGNPLGYSDTATTGIISALNRPVSVVDGSNEIVTNAVQIDAAVNPGNSGGPTFNGAGQVIGINSSIASTSSSSDTAGSIGIGFAIPSNLVKRVASEIISDGSAKHVALGVTIKSGTVTADNVTRAGAVVNSVVSGGPADKAGVKQGDTIVAFNGNAVSSTYSLLGFVRASALNDKATLTVVRDGKTIELTVTLDRAESEVNGSSSSNSNNNQNQNNNNNQNNQDQDQNQDNNSQNGNNNYDDGGLFDPFGLW